MDCQSNDIEQKITSLQHKLQCGSYNCTSGKSKYSHIRQIYLRTCSVSLCFGKTDGRYHFKDRSLKKLINPVSYNEFGII